MPLVLLLIVVSLAFGWILLPFFGAIMWAAIIALLFAPLHRRIVTRLQGRATLAALVTLGVVVVMVILPVALIAASMASEAASLVQRLQSGDLKPIAYLHGLFDALPAWVTSVLDRFGLVDFNTLQVRLTDALAKGGQFIATQALSIGLNTFEFVSSLFIMLYLAFFLLRDGDALALMLRQAIPLAPAHKQELLAKFATVIRATVKGNLVVAALQGALGGVAFWYLGISGALLWAVLMAFLSLLPAVGAGLVWVPVALYYLVTGALWQCIALTAYGVLVIGLVDNVLRPALVGKDTRLPDYLVMICTLGGMAVFGVNGFVIGPVIAALFMAVWHIHLVNLGKATTPANPGS